VICRGDSALIAYNYKIKLIVGDESIHTLKGRVDAPSLSEALDAAAKEAFKTFTEGNVYYGIPACGGPYTIDTITLERIGVLK